VEKNSWEGGERVGNSTLTNHFFVLKLCGTTIRAQLIVWTRPVFGLVNLNFYSKMSAYHKGFLWITNFFTIPFRFLQ
jgi:hypothetical protein